MSLRVNPNPMPGLLAQLAQNLRQENEALLQVSSTRRLNRLSDEPVSVAQLVRNRSQSRAAAQFSSNISSVRGLLQVADSALNSVVTALTRAVSLGVRGANSTLSPENRAAIAEELIGLKAQLRGQANISYQGNYIFAGTAFSTQPFVDDAGQPSGLRYDGNTGVNDVQITEGQSLPVNVPGSQIFTAPGADVFLGLAHLITALQTGANIAAATGEVQAAFNRVNGQRSFYGGALARLDTASSFLESEKFQLSQQENDLVAADMIYAASALVQTVTARNATLAAAGKLSQLSLLDFLR